MNTEEFNDEMHGTSQRAVSIYGHDDSVEDFPVLKAFQQYIDAEQEKARKRILNLGIFFGIALVIVIAVFMVLLHSINTRNQLLSDRLFEYAMKESSRSQSANPPATNNDAALKSMTDTLVLMQKQMMETKRDTDADGAGTDRQSRIETEKLQRAKALLAEEKQRLAVEKERLHQIEIEQQRRKLYPELYRDGEPEYVPYGSRRKQQRTRTLTDDDIREIIREAYPDAESMPSAQKTTATKTETTDDQADDDKQDGAVEYFKDDDYTIPIDIKGKSSKVKFTVPVD